MTKFLEVCSFQINQNHMDEIVPIYLHRPHATQTVRIPCKVTFHLSELSWVMSECDQRVMNVQFGANNPQLSNVHVIQSCVTSLEWVFKLNKPWHGNCLGCHLQTGNEDLLSCDTMTPCDPVHRTIIQTIPCSESNY